MDVVDSAAGEVALVEVRKVKGAEATDVVEDVVNIIADEVRDTTLDVTGTDVVEAVVDSIDVVNVTGTDVTVIAGVVTVESVTELTVAEDVVVTDIMVDADDVTVDVGRVVAVVTAEEVGVVLDDVVIEGSEVVDVGG